MALQIDWGMLSRAPDPGVAFRQAFQEGRERGQANAREAALSNYAANPTTDALAPLAAVDPQAFVALSRHERDRSDFVREGRGREAYAGYLREHEGELQGRRYQGRGTALPRREQAPGPTPPTHHPGMPLDVLASGSGAPVPNALEPVAPPSPMLDDDPSAEIVVTGRPRVAPPVPSRRYSFADVALESPEMSERLSRQIAGIDKAHYDNVDEYFGAIGAVATRARELPVEERAAFLDANRDYLRLYGVTDAEMDDFDDGDASLDGLIRIAMGVKDTLANSRADRNTDSVIEDRDGRRALVARGQNMTDARGRYGIGVASADRRRGQDIGSTDRRRGQDVGATTARRGQDITDRRVRETGGRRRGGATAAAPPKVGEVRQGYRFKGGNPSDRANWVKAS